MELVWYVILSAAVGSSLTGPATIGPFTQIDCQKAIVALQGLPTAMSAECKGAVGFSTISASNEPWRGYARPVFEGEMTISGRR